MKTRKLILFLVFCTSFSSWGQSRITRSDDGVSNREAIPSAESPNESLGDFRFRMIICKAIEVDDIISQVLQDPSVLMNHTKALIGRRHKLLGLTRSWDLKFDSAYSPGRPNWEVPNPGWANSQDEFFGGYYDNGGIGLRIFEMRPSVAWNPYRSIFEIHVGKTSFSWITPKPFSIVDLELDFVPQLGSMEASLSKDSGFSEIGVPEGVLSIGRLTVGDFSVKVNNSRTGGPTKFVFNTQRFVNCVRDRGVVKKLIEDFEHEKPQ